MNALVSIIMPVYNVERFVEAAIASVIHQTYPQWELVIVHNGSQDKSVEIVNQFSDKRIRIFHEEKRGVSHARNKGLDESQGEFICFLDADDIMPERSLDVRIKHLIENKQISFCDGDVVIYDEEMKHILRVFHPSSIENVQKEMSKLQPKCFAGITWMIRSDAIGQIRFPTNWQHFEDRIFFRSISMNKSYGFAKEEIYHIRKRAHSSTSDLSQLEKSYLRFIEEEQIPLLNSAELRAEKKIFHKTFFRSYLKNGKVLKAFKQLMQLISIKN